MNENSAKVQARSLDNRYDAWQQLYCNIEQGIVDKMCSSKEYTAEDLLSR